ncbi:MAG: TIGR03564 family F420-dependent LLM class oxidoreductase [Acidimicrobiales bacterium]
MGMPLAVFGTADTIEAIADDVAAAAALGFGSYWTPQIFGPDALTALTLASARTPDIRLGTAVVPVQPRHPMALAQQALTVNQVAAGRLDLGIGLSHQPVVEGMWGISFDRPVRYMSDYLAVLMPLLHGEKVSHGGEKVTGRGEIRVRAEAPPVYVAALGEQMLKLAGRRADGTITWMTGPATIADLTVPTITEAAGSAGRPAPRIIAAVPVCLAGDQAEIGALHRRAAEEYVVYGQLPSYRAMLDHEGLDGPADLALIGSIDRIAEGLGRFVDAGATTVVVNTFGAPDQQAATRKAVAGLL